MLKELESELKLRGFTDKTVEAYLYHNKAFLSFSNKEENDGERSLREIVVMKKIIGTLRNQNGADVMAKIMTLISTWRLNGQSPFYSLRAII